MIAVILFQVNILTLAMLINCSSRKRNGDGEQAVSLVQPGMPSPSGSAINGSKPANDDFSVGVPPPHIPLADKSDERTLADIESIQSEKVLIKDKKAKMEAGKAKTTTSIANQSPGGKNLKATSPALNL
ncbi:unnamed protein product [Caenorhabditis sp. 36 PRJEB53466]|nr:unnamed protein product [Caenorhabditis sp. 36 PRJEB53466]